MFYVRIIDENGFFVCDSFVDELSKNTIKIPCPDGLYRPKWNGAKWVEGLTQAEIDTIKASIPVDIKAQAIQEIESATTISALKVAMLKYVNAE